MRFSFEPLSKEFSNRCVFDENAQLISVDGSYKRIEIHTYIHTYFIGSSPRGFSESNVCILSENALMLTGPKISGPFIREKISRGLLWPRLS